MPLALKFCLTRTFQMFEQQCLIIWSAPNISRTHAPLTWSQEANHSFCFFRDNWCRRPPDRTDNYRRQTEWKRMKFYTRPSNRSQKESRHWETCTSGDWGGGRCGGDIYNCSKTKQNPYSSNQNSIRWGWSGYKDPGLGRLGIKWKKRCTFISLINIK